MLGLIWWLLYCLVAVWLQYFFPGLDFIVPGVVVSLQEENWWRSSAWLVGFAVLLQDGMGGLGFGYGLAWYGLILLVFELGRRFFDPRSGALVGVLAVFLGLLHFSLTYSLTQLEGMGFTWEHALWESVAQAALFPPLWYIIHKIFPERLKEDERTA
ncbi:hypothetical protein SAMN02745704_02153 [Paucidesulfovibrio gracilis DSM 16080]|uniref:Rod shape-determining protein MreD n=1 Tax=Paucidesulfovibrio gracilis DSM 16080 TaxID=1121449 RepID=A0A1T4XJG4_9BACT|nr:hypothetical protein [Paucidesulfovibrio gracilis]SKA89553.1 hypothetical protein SAMN02745704_02153 [Paucidesulfovibrio gracilis DSM 16080]